MPYEISFSKLIPLTDRDAYDRSASNVDLAARAAVRT